MSTLSYSTFWEGFPERSCSFCRAAPFNAVATRSSPFISLAAPSLYLPSTCGGIKLSGSYRTLSTPCARNERTKTPELSLPVRIRVDDPAFGRVPRAAVKSRRLCGPESSLHRVHRGNLYQVAFKNRARRSSRGERRRTVVHRSETGRNTH